MSDKPWRDSERLKEMYYGKNMSQPEIAEVFGCAQHTISRWMDKHDIDTRDDYWKRAHEANRVDRATFATDQDGYEISKSRCGYETDIIYVHRLLAVAEYGFDAMADSVVHHKNEVKWDNRPENLEVMGDSQHKRLHAIKRGGE